MKRHKRIVAILVALTFLFSLAVPAMAGNARFADVSGANLTKAVERLANLEILQGYPDGSFKPENAITRAEFAAVAVRALGLDLAAQASKGATPFSDVAGTHWAAGVINVAAQQGIINGYPDGTFKPNANVTHAEALAMMVRLLGYEDTTIGTWPTKYLVKAAQLGLNKNIVVSANAQATRAEVALITDNALDTPMWVLTETQDGKKVYREGDTLLAKSLRVVKIEDVWVTEVPLVNSALDANEIIVDIDGDEITFELNISNVSANDLIGERLDIWVRDNNRDGKLDLSKENIVLAVERKSEVVTGQLKELKDGRFVMMNGTTVRYLGTTEVVFNYDIDNATDVTTVTAAELNKHYTVASTDGIKEALVKIVKDSNGRAKAIYALQNVSYSPLNSSVIIDAVDTSKPELRVKRPEGALVTRVDLKDKTVYVQKNGAFVELSELDKGDVANIYRLSNNDVFFIVATDETVTGEVSFVVDGGIKPAAHNKGVINLVGGKKVTVAHTAGYSNDGTATAITQYGDIADFAKNNVEIKLNVFGHAVYVSGAMSFSSTEVIYDKAVVEQGFNGPQVRVFTLDGTTVTYEIKSSDRANWFDAGNGDAEELSKGDVIKLKIDSKGKVELDTTFSITEDDGTFDETDDTNNRVKLDGNWYRVNSSTKFITADLTKQVSDWKVYTWNEFKTTDMSGETVAYDLTSANVVKYVVIYDAISVAAAGEQYGVVAGTAKAGTKDFLTVKVNGTDTTYEINSGSAVKGDLIRFSLTSDKKINVLSTTALGAHDVTDIDLSAMQITLNSGAITLQLADDVQVYSVNASNTFTAKTLYDIDTEEALGTGSSVEYMKNSKDLIKLIVIQP